MWFRCAADLVLLVHFGFILFVIFGGVLALRWPRLVVAHIPVVLYGAIIEFVGFTCPLTPLENALRHRGGEAGYSDDFINHYIGATLYPAGLTRSAQLVLGAIVLVLNIAVYAIWARQRVRARG